MSIYEKMVSKIVFWGLIVGTLALVGVMVIIDANILWRAFGSIIAGTYDLVEITIVIAVAFGLTYTEFYQAHTRVDLFTSKMPKKMRLCFEYFSNFLSGVYWSIIVYATAKITVEKAALGEKTDLLKISIIPFRVVWLIGLILVVLLVVLNTLKAKKTILGGRDES
jgi:TRAP-type C4-dicarboxylate transport system permease small subunit